MLISSDDLNATEETVYMAVMKWINHDTRTRKKEMKELMELVRFPFMDRMYFLEKVETNNAVCKSCPDIVMETRRYQLFPGEVQSPRTRPRRASGLREAVVAIGGRGSDFGFAVAVLGTSDIVVSVGRSSTKAVWLYHVELDSWARRAPMNVSRSFHKLAVVQAGSGAR
ncbi:kelch-like protein 24a [Branchiostoma lanceolatum]|uniref:kelch-like protein 24a n=1 Tax=Branchiostoma lanceolatum TaxID=7740 RepID=UPI003453EF0C